MQLTVQTLSIPRWAKSYLELFKISMEFNSISTLDQSTLLMVRGTILKCIQFITLLQLQLVKVLQVKPEESVLQLLVSCSQWKIIPPTWRGPSNKSLILSSTHWYWAHLEQMMEQVILLTTLTWLFMETWCKWLTIIIDGYTRDLWLLHLVPHLFTGMFYLLFILFQKDTSIYSRHNLTKEKVDN